ncbi:MFS transporter [Tepidamorphus sp. 3E244]|uniref:MFS transporter n=1 Tax=Tepidamorphus sp. 3E244 TaxID=3385498 RepID=UPI0038FC5304
MLAVLANVTYRRLLTAQIVALFGTGLATVALALLAYDLAGENAGAVLGTALFIKMIAYVGISPFAGVIVTLVPRKALLVAMDVVRLAIALLLPFVTEIWQVYILIFALQSASAVFTPTFQAIIPDVLPDENDYTRALSLSRLAYDLENLLSPTIAAVLLLAINFHWLFAGTALGFLVSAMLVLTVALPEPVSDKQPTSFLEKATRGIRIYLATPRLRGLLALNVTVAFAGAMVIVNTVVIVRSLLAGSQSDVGFAMATFGAGSIVAALAVPRLLQRVADRTIMLAGAAVLAILMVVTALMVATLDAGLWLGLLLAWPLMGLSSSMIQTPGGRLLKRSTHSEDRPAVFAAQFALSHACWLIAYPLAGWLGSSMGISLTFTLLSAPALLGCLAAFWLWPPESDGIIEHTHDNLSARDPHWAEGTPTAHRLPYVLFSD